MNVLALREQLETLLTEGDYLGEYVLANGTHTPAISVRASGESFPAGTIVTGMECVILREPELQPIRQYEAEEAFRRWTVYLVNWSEAVSLNEVAGVVLRQFPGSNAVSITVPRGVGPRSQMRIDIQTNPPLVEL